MAKRKVVDIVGEALEPFLEDNGYELFQIEYVKEGRDWVLRVSIDIKGESEGTHVGIEDCEKVSRYLSARLDELDPIEKNYMLEVSSPGIDRPLLRDSDYEKYKGRRIDISLFQSSGAGKLISGELVGLREGKITIIDEKKQQIEIPRENVSKVKLAVIF